MQLLAEGDYTDYTVALLILKNRMQNTQDANQTHKSMLSLWSLECIYKALDSSSLFAQADICRYLTAVSLYQTITISIFR